jgi:zinc protease
MAPIFLPIRISSAARKNRIAPLKKWPWVIFLLAACLALAGKGFCAAPNPEVEVLDNGVRVISVSDPGLPLVAVNIVVRAGSACEPEGQSGVAHLLEHLLFRGSRNYRPGEVAEVIESQGGAANAGTLRDFIHLYAVVPTAGFEKTLAALSDALLYPSLDDMEIERERGVLLQEIAGDSENPQAVLWDLAHKALLPDHPYSHPVSGEANSLFGLNREQLQRFHDLWFVSERISVVIVGDISHERALALAKQNFAGLPRSSGGKECLPVTPGGAISDQVSYHGGALAFIGLAARAPAVSSPREVCVCDVLLSLLGNGRDSLLRRSLMGDAMLALDTGGEFLTSRGSSPFLLWASCRPEQREGVKSRMAAALDQVIAGQVTPAELAAAKRDLMTSYWLSNETYVDRADVLGFYEALQDLQFGRGYIVQVRAVGLSDIQAAAKKYFSPTQRVWIELIPREGKAVAAH